MQVHSHLRAFLAKERSATSRPLRATLIGAFTEFVAVRGKRVVAGRCRDTLEVSGISFRGAGTELLELLGILETARAEPMLLIAEPPARMNLLLTERGYKETEGGYYQVLGKL